MSIYGYVSVSTFAASSSTILTVPLELQEMLTEDINLYNVAMFAQQGTGTYRTDIEVRTQNKVSFLIYGRYNPPAVAGTVYITATIML